MSNLRFPNLKEIPFQPISPLLSSYQFDTHSHSSLYDFGCLLSEFFQQIRRFADSGANFSYTYRQLVERSEILGNWVELLITQYGECLPYLPEGFSKKSFESLLIHIRNIYCHPLLTSIWLGLEMVTILNNNKQETEFLRYLVIATHYDHELIEQFKQFLNLIPNEISIDALQSFMGSASTEKINENFIETFMTLSAPILFQIAALGKADLAASGLEIYHHYLIYLDKIRLKQAYLTSLHRIQRRMPKQYQHDESIYAISDPIFDCHITMTANFINKNTHNKQIYLHNENGKLPDGMQSILTKLENNIEFICTLRGRLIRFKSKNYLQQIKDILYQSISPKQKAHVIELLTSGWYGWVKKRYKDESILVNECLSMASALATKVSDQ